MSREQKKKGGKQDSTLTKLLLLTATANLIKAVIDLIKALTG